MHYADRWVLVSVPFLHLCLPLSLLPKHRHTHIKTTPTQQELKLWSAHMHFGLLLKAEPPAMIIKGPWICVRSWRAKTLGGCMGEAAVIKLYHCQINVLFVNQMFLSHNLNTRFSSYFITLLTCYYVRNQSQRLKGLMTCACTFSHSKLILVIFYS